MRLIAIITGLILIRLLMFPTNIQGQFLYPENISVKLSKADSIYASKLPKLVLPQLYKSGKAKNLPSELNNSTLPFFRSIFSQEGYWNCGQASSIGYNFTYEINLARGLNGDTSINQYSPNFTFNFMNGGDGWGVSYFNSFDAVKACGNPNLFDYGGLFNGGDVRWMSGYELYENAMQNRIKQVYTIDVSTLEGLITLKYWLLDHLNGSEYGGVANFYLGASASGYLPPESPDAGLQVIAECFNFAGHSMTIVGYNDSIRYDVNNDGQFTNDVDINNDGFVDMKDWEIGGLRFINSSVNNNGTGYLLYRTLALEYGSGGIWNQQMNVITVKENYEPLVNIRIKLMHNSRNKLKIIAGISADTSKNYPEYTMDFPIFNYQGGDRYMQGSDTPESQKIIELALDISPLLQHVHSNNQAKFFVQVAENDEDNVGEGQILYYSLVDHTVGFSEIVCDDVPSDIYDNAITTLQVMHAPVFEEVAITTEDLPGIPTGITQIIQFEAEGGYPPYSWEFLVPYILNPIQVDFPEINNEQLVFENNIDARTDVELPFPFPYYGDTIHNITIYIDGFIMFENNPFPYPYYVGEESLIKGEKVIAPFMSDMALYSEKNDGVWIDKYDDYIAIRWKVSAEAEWLYSDVNFSVILYPDGKIETNYGYVNYPETRLWAVGISSGDRTNYELNQLGHHLDELSNTSFEYLPTLDLLPDSLYMSESGELSVLVNNESEVYPLTLQVLDDKGITDVKSYNLSSSGLSFSYQISPGNGNFVEYDETTAVSLSINNDSPNTYENLQVMFSSLDDFLVLNDTIESLGNLVPQQSIEISNITTFTFSPEVPDRYNSIIRYALVTDDNQWSSNINLTVNAPDYQVIKTEIIDNNDQLLFPGETAKIRLVVQNKGHSRSMVASCTLNSDYEHIEIISPDLNQIGELNPGDTASVEFSIRADYFVPMGSQIQLEFKIFNNETIISSLLTNLKIGLVPVLILDLDPKQNSGLQIRDILDDYGLKNNYRRIVPDNLDDYLSVFVCTGGLIFNHNLTESEGTLLADYLESSGNVYMEGIATWAANIQTPVHSMFNIEVGESGDFIWIDSLIGVNDNYTKDMTYNIVDDFYYSYSTYSIYPGAGASTWLVTNISDTSGVVVANQSENYSTIASKVLFGTLIDNDTINMKEEYLISILDFFDIKKYLYADISQTEFISDKINMEVFPNPAKDKLTIKFFNTTHNSSYYQILNIQGKLIIDQRIADNGISGGSTSVIWNCRDMDGKDLPAGIYLIQYISGKQSITKKIILN